MRSYPQNERLGSKLLLFTLLDELETQRSEYHGRQKVTIKTPKGTTKRFVQCMTHLNLLAFLAMDLRIHS